VHGDTGVCDIITVAFWGRWYARAQTEAAIAAFFVFLPILCPGSGDYCAVGGGNGSVVTAMREGRRSTLVRRLDESVV
jgi:hypothetical protein